MSERTLVGAFPYQLRADGTPTQESHVIFAYESSDQTKSWKIKEVQFWLNPVVTSGGDGRAILSCCLSTDFLNEPLSPSVADMQEYALQFNASDNRGIAWGMMDYQNRTDVADFRVPSFEWYAIADGRRAINYLILNAMVITENAALQPEYNWVNYRVVMEELKVSPTESILHQVRGMSQDVDFRRPN